MHTIHKIPFKRLLLATSAKLDILACCPWGSGANRQGKGNGRLDGRPGTDGNGAGAAGAGAGFAAAVPGAFGKESGGFMSWRL